MAELYDLLAKTSRTFGISIPLLAEPTRREVAVAYLMFRVADTFEDGDRWPPERRIEALEELVRLLSEEDDDGVRRLAERSVADPPLDHAGYLELLAELPYVFATWRALDHEAARSIAHHTSRTARGMAAYVARIAGPHGDEALRIRDVPDLERYCYLVAGVVGEMLSDLFRLRHPGLAPYAEPMRRGAREFGEGLQLVNILKDADDDEAVGRLFLPDSAERAEVMAAAREGLEGGLRYVVTLGRGGAHPGCMAFLVLPLFLAWATLDRVELAGPGSKVDRAQVARFVAAVERGVLSGPPPDAEALRRLYAEASSEMLPESARSPV